MSNRDRDLSKKIKVFFQQKHSVKVPTRIVKEADAQPETQQTSKLESFAKIGNGFQTLTIPAKLSILNICGVLSYTSRKMTLLILFRFMFTGLSLSFHNKK